NLWYGNAADNRVAGGLAVNLSEAARRIGGWDGQGGVSGQDAVDEVRGVFTQAEKYGGPWQGSAYRPWMRKEYALPVVQALASGGKDGAALDPKQAWELLSDMADSADFDWPGGSKEMFTAWWGHLMTLRRVGSYPQDFTEQRLQEVLSDFLE